MATVAETLTWEDVRADLAEYIGVDEEDLSVAYEMRFLAAVDLADAFLNNPFEDDDGVDIDLPTAVKLGVFEWVRKMASLPVGGKLSEKTGDLQATWSANAAMSDKDIYERYWRKWRLEPGL